MSGYDVSRAIFLDGGALFKNYRCPSCQYLLRDAVQPSCGHCLCQSCAEELFQKSGERGVLPKCPDCEEELTQVGEGIYYYHDEYVRKAIRNVAVQCLYHEEGCTWKGKFIDYWEHICGCRLSPKHQPVSPQLEAVYDVLHHGITAFGKILENGTPQMRDQGLGVLQAGSPQVQKFPRFENPHMFQTMYPIHDGRVVVVFQQCIANNIIQCTTNLPFYTGHRGYKACLRLCILGDGIGKNTHMSLFFVIMRGEFDNVLQWPFTYRVTFRIMNQTPDGQDIIKTFRPDPTSTSFQKPKSKENPPYGFPNSISYQELMSGGFVNDGTILIKCIIDTA